MTDEASTDPKYPLGKLEQSLASNELISIRETLALVTQLGQDIERDIDQIRAGLLHLTVRLLTHTHVLGMEINESPPLFRKRLWTTLGVF